MQGQISARWCRFSLTAVVAVFAALAVGRGNPVIAHAQTGPAAAPMVQAVVAPGTAVVPPEGRVLFAFPTPVRGPAGPHGGVEVVSRASQPAKLEVDATNLTITAPTGYAVAPTIDCTADRSLAVDVCPLADNPEFVDFTLVDVRAPDILPQSATVKGPPLGLAARLDSGSAAVIAIWHATSAFSTLTPAPSLRADWDGATLTISVPNGYKVVVPPALGGTCIPLDAMPTIVACGAPGAPPYLYELSSDALNPGRRFPPATPPNFQAAIVRPTPNDRYSSGQPVTFEVQGSSKSAYLWTFGDGNAAGGMTVQHAYTKPGLYTVGLLTIDVEGGHSSQTVLVSVDQPPVQATYPAGWNLVGLPHGTPLSGTEGPLYGWTYPFCEFIAPPPPLGPGASPGPTPEPCVYQYIPVAPDDPQRLGLGYWAYFPKATTMTLPFVAAPSGDFLIPAGRYQIVANPTVVPATVKGAAAVFIYDAASRRYRQTNTLPPGQAGWVYTSPDDTPFARITIDPVPSNP